MRLVTAATQIIGAIIAASVAIGAGPIAQVGWLGTAAMYATWVATPFLLFGWAAWLTHGDDFSARVLLWGGGATAVGAVLAYLVPALMIGTRNVGIAILSVPPAHLIVVFSLFAVAFRPWRTSLRHHH